MFKSTFKTVAVTSVALAALLALGACSKKEETNTTVMPPAASTPSPSTDSSSSGSTVSPGAAPMGTSTMGSGTPAPMPAASEAK